VRARKASFTPFVDGFPSIFPILRTTRPDHDMMLPSVQSSMAAAGAISPLRKSMLLVRSSVRLGANPFSSLTEGNVLRHGDDDPTMSAAPLISELLRAAKRESAAADEKKSALYDAEVCGHPEQRFGVSVFGGKTPLRRHYEKSEVAQYRRIARRATRRQRLIALAVPKTGAAAAADAAAATTTTTTTRPEGHHLPECGKEEATPGPGAYSVAEALSFPLRSDLSTRQRRRRDDRFVTIAKGSDEDEWRRDWKEHRRDDSDGQFDEKSYEEDSEEDLEDGPEDEDEGEDERNSGGIGAGLLSRRARRLLRRRRKRLRLRREIRRLRHSGTPGPGSYCSIDAQGGGSGGGGHQHAAHVLLCGRV
jgi:hypothetical protein